MKIFLAGTSINKEVMKYNPKYILESFYYIKDWQIKEIPNFEMFLLDSGAFTFMNNKKDNINWIEYIDKYANFINDNNIKYFFELDIDSIVGYEKVKEYTRYLENKTGKQCIPVWHISRGIEEYKRLTKEYTYIAIGGIVTKEIKKSQYNIFEYLIKIAHKNNCKVHGLGFTSTSLLHKYHFDSVDSTSWLSASRFGSMYYFDGSKIVQYKKPSNSRTIYYKKCEDFIFQEWIKFQKYADIKL